MSAEELAVIFRPAIPGRDYLAKSAEKANARGILMLAGSEQSTRLADCNRTRWDAHAEPNATSVAETSLSYGRNPAPRYSREAEFEGRRSASRLTAQRPFDVPTPAV